MYQIVCGANQTWPCVLGAYPTGENVNAIHIIIAAIILIQKKKQRMPRSRASRNPGLQIWLLGSISIHFWKEQGGRGQVIGSQKKQKTGVNSDKLMTDQYTFQCGNNMK